MSARITISCVLCVMGDVTLFLSPSLCYRRKLFVSLNRLPTQQVVQHPQKSTGGVDTNTKIRETRKSLRRQGKRRSQRFVLYVASCVTMYCMCVYTSLPDIRVVGVSSSQW